METLEILKEQFVSYAISQYQALENGEGRKANRIHKKIHSIYLKLKNLDRVDVLKDFLNDEHECVRLWVAGFCLKIAPKLAEQELKRLKKSSDFLISSAAEVTLKLYRNNEWDKLLV